MMSTWALNLEQFVRDFLQLRFIVVDEDRNSKKNNLNTFTSSLWIFKAQQWVKDCDFFLQSQFFLLLIQMEMSRVFILLPNSRFTSSFNIKKKRSLLHRTKSHHGTDILFAVTVDIKELLLPLTYIYIHVYAYEFRQKRLKD